MISLIKFEKDLVLEREEAERLGFSFTEVRSQKLMLEDECVVAKSGSYYRYWDEVEKVDTVENGEVVSTTYFSGDKEIDLYYIISRLPENLAGRDYVVCNSEQFVPLEIAAQYSRWPFKIIKTVSDNKHLESSMLHLLTKIEAKAETFRQLDEKLSQQFNESCSVAVSGGLICTFNKVQLLEDCCTDALQDALDSGWKIIAACVQPDQRRPDYILGKFSSTS